MDDLLRPHSISQPHSGKVVAAVEIFVSSVTGGKECCPKYEWLQGLTKSEIRFEEVTVALLNYSLIESCQDSESYSMHLVIHNYHTETKSHDKNDFIVATLTIVDTTESNV